MASSEQDDTTKEPFFLSLAAWRSGDCKADVHISLVPPLTLENLLAVPIEIKLSSPYSPITSHRLFSGDLVPVTSVRGSEQISIQMLLATGVFAWSSHLELVLDNVPANEQSASLTCTAVDPDHNALLLKWVKTVTSDGAVVLSVYCDYELINKSGLPMLFRTQPTPTSTSVCAGQHQLEVDLKADIQSQVYTGDPLAWYPLGSPFQKPQLLLLGVANIRQECKLQVRAADSNWSEPLAIQTTRASGTILLSRHKPSPDSTTASSSWSWLLGSTASPASLATAAVQADSVEGLIPLSISVELCTGKFWRTKRVVFYPGCLLINRLEDVSLYYRQAPAPAPSPSASTTTTTPSDSNPDLHWSGFHLPAGSSVPLMWPRERLARLLQVRSHSTADEATPAVDSEWSIGFQVDAPRSFLLCLTSGGMSGAPRNLYVRVTVTQITSLMETELRDSSALAVVFAPAMGHFDYVLENNTRFAMRYYQENCQQFQSLLESSAKVPYVWSDPDAEKRLLVVELLHPPGDPEHPSEVVACKFHVLLDRLGTLPLLEIKSKSGEASLGRCRAEVAVGSHSATKHLLLSELSSNAALQPMRVAKPVAAATSSPSLDAEDEQQAPDRSDEQLKLMVSFKAARVGFSLITQGPAELLFVLFEDMALTMRDFASSQSLTLSIGRFQADNQHLETPFPVFMRLISSSDSDSSDGTPAAAPSLVQALVVRRKAAAQSAVLYLESVSITFGSISMTFDDALLDSLAAFSSLFSDLFERRLALKSALATKRKRDSYLASHADTADEKQLFDPFFQVYEASLLQYVPVLASKKRAPLLEDAPPPPHGQDKDDLEHNDDLMQSMVYVKFLHIEPMVVRITFKTVTRVEEPDASSQRLLQMGRLLPNIDDAMLPLNGLAITHCFDSQWDVVARIGQHYRAQLLHGWHRILGSADFLGSPISLVHHLGTGVYDFFREPVRGLVTGPREFALGLAKGSSSLVKHSVHGVFNTVSKISGTISKGVAMMSLDYEYQRQRDLAVQPRHIGEGFAQGVVGLGMSIYDGVTGVVSQPMVRSHSGVAGVMTGVLLGATGVVTKPLAGAFGMVSKMGEGIKNTLIGDSDWQHTYERVRLVRVFGARGELRCYDALEALGQFVLRRIDGARFAGHALCHVLELAADATKSAPATGSLLLVTDQGFLVLFTLTAPPTSAAATAAATVLKSQWVAKVESLQGVQLLPTQLVLLFSSPPSGITPAQAQVSSSETSSSEGTNMAATTTATTTKHCSMAVQLQPKMHGTQVYQQLLSVLKNLRLAHEEPTILLQRPSTTATAAMTMTAISRASE